MNASEPVDNRTQRPHLTLASAVMFVADLGRSVVFYQELLGFETTARTEEAALLVSPDGYQLYLRSMGKRAQHPIGAIGIQYLVWTAESEDDLQRCERVLKAQSPQVTSTTVDGFRMVEGRGPDNVPVVITFPGPDQAPRHGILRRIYAW
jgi:catechol 2,3-dioxygenase-like lactoylglutathione lyase family enzyme